MKVKLILWVISFCFATFISGTLIEGIVRYSIPQIIQPNIHESNLGIPNGLRPNYRTTISTENYPTYTV